MDDGRKKERNLILDTHSTILHYSCRTYYNNNNFLPLRPLDGEKSNVASQNRRVRRVAHAASKSEVD